MKFALLTLIALFGVAYGLDCLRCKLEDPGCALDGEDPDLEKYSRPCTNDQGLKALYCTKFTYTNKVTGNVRYFRGCGYNDQLDRNMCNDTAPSTNDNIHFCTCDFDDCNSASGLSVNMLMTSAMIVLGLTAARGWMC